MQVLSILATTTATALLLATQASAHGGMIEPAPRALTTMGLSIDSTFGHPIPMRASYTNGKGGDCLGFTPDTNLKPLATGRSKIKMRANDGANHVGLCTAYLVDPRNSNNKLQVGQLNDCMRSLHPGPGSKGNAPILAEMTIDIPSDTSKLPCNGGHCVLQFAWEASHVTPHEFYNNCADVRIGGGGSGGNPAPAPAPVPAPGPQPNPVPAPRPNPAPAPRPNPAPAPRPNPAPVPAPATGCKYVYIGTHADRVALTQWCNWNCPSFCPTDMCKSSC